MFVAVVVVSVHIMPGITTCNKLYIHVKYASYTFKSPYSAQNFIGLALVLFINFLQETITESFVTFIDTMYVIAQIL